MTKLIVIEGIGETYDAKLKGAGVKTLETLLEKGANPKGRRDLAAAAGIDADFNPEMGQSSRSFPRERSGGRILRSARSRWRGHCG